MMSSSINATNQLINLNFMNMKKTLLKPYFLAILGILFAINSSQAQVGPLVSWEFVNPAPINGTQATSMSTSTDNGVEQSELSRGSGFSLNPGALNKTFKTISKTYATLNTPVVSPVKVTTRLEAPDDYFQVKFQAKPGNIVNLTAIDFKLLRDATGGNAYRWAFSKDGVTFTDLGTTDGSYTRTYNTGTTTEKDADGKFQDAVDLNVPALQNLTSDDIVTFRLYIWGFSGTAGFVAFGRHPSDNFDFTPSLAIRGTVTNPSTANLLAWNFNTANAGAATDGTETSVAATTVHTNLNASQIVKGLGVGVPATLQSSINGVFPISADFATAQTNNSYYEFEVSSNETNKFISLYNINARVRRDANGASKYRWAYSLDNGTTFTPIGTESTALRSTSGYTLPTVNLATIPALQNMSSTSTVKFRVYFWGATVAGGNTAIGGIPGYNYPAITLTPFFNIIPYQSYNGLELKGMVTDNKALLSWQFSGVAGAIDNYNSTVTASGITQSLLYRGDGLEKASLANGFSSTLAPTNVPYVVDEATALEKNTYYEFKVNVDAGYAANLSKLKAKIRRSTNGVTGGSFRVSSDNGLSFSTLLPFTLPGGGAPNIPNDGFPFEIDLSGLPALQNVTSSKTIIFRIYGWDNHDKISTTGTFAFGRGDGTSVPLEMIPLELQGIVEATLPVSLASFTATKQANGIQLSWTTTSESNNSHFDVLKSNDGQNWTLLTTVQGNGNSDKVINYSYVDANPFNGANYYQLKQVDRNGTTDFSEITSVNFNLQNENSLAVNYTDGVLRVFINTAKAEKVSVVLYDLNGKMVTSQKAFVNNGNNQVEIPVRLTAGTYVVTVKGNNSVSATKLIAN